MMSASILVFASSAGRYVEGPSHNSLVVEKCTSVLETVPIRSNKDKLDFSVLIPLFVVVLQYL